MSNIIISVETETVTLKNQSIDLLHVGAAIGDMTDEQLVGLLCSIRMACESSPKAQEAIANLYKALDETKDAWVLLAPKVSLNKAFMTKVERAEWLKRLKA